MADAPHSPTASGEPGGKVTLRNWPVYRNNLSDFLHNAQLRKNVSFCWEVEITRVLERVSQVQRETKIAISLNAYWIHLLAQAIQQHPTMQAVRVPWRRQIAHYDGVDVGTAVEQRVPGYGSIAVPYTIRDAHKKSLAQICVELRGARKRNLIADDPGLRMRGRLAHFPRFARLLFWKWVDLNPARRRRIRGTVGITNLSFLSDQQRPAFGMPLALLPSNLTVGSTYPKLVPCDTDPRGFRVANMLCLTLTSDHEIVDGAPMVRFGRTLTQAIERADGLDDTLAAQLIAAFRPAAGVSADFADAPDSAP